MFHILRTLPEYYEYMGNSFSSEMANIICAKLIDEEERLTVDYVVVDTKQLQEFYSYDLVNGIPDQIMIDMEKEMELIK